MDGGSTDLYRLRDELRNGITRRVIIYQLHMAVMKKKGSCSVRSLDNIEAAMIEQGLGTDTTVVVCEAVWVLLRRTFGFWRIAHLLWKLVFIGTYANAAAAKLLSDGARDYKGASTALIVTPRAVAECSFALASHLPRVATQVK